jgi:hypothetical protein
MDAADRTYIPATHPKSDFGQGQTHKVTPEALSLVPVQQDTIANERETYPLQNQTTVVAPEALAIFFGSAGYHVDLCWAAPSERTQSRGSSGGYVHLSLNNNSLAQYQRYNPKYQFRRGRYH